MISLDQVLLLQKKVETAVQKISLLNEQNEQLKSENDALRSKCLELTKALSEKSELVSLLEADQSKIEQGILLALDRLDTVENAVLNTQTAEKVNTTEQAPQETISNKEDNSFTEEFIKNEPPSDSALNTNEVSYTGSDKTIENHLEESNVESEPVSSAEQEALFTQKEKSETTSDEQNAFSPEQYEIF